MKQPSKHSGPATLKGPFMVNEGTPGLIGGKADRGGKPVPAYEAPKPASNGDQRSGMEKAIADSCK